MAGGAVQNVKVQLKRKGNYMDADLKKFVEEHFSVPGRVLDLGAGDFADIESLKALGWTCEGVDLKTGVNLNKEYRSSAGPFSLVYSNFVIHKLYNPQALLDTVNKNLIPGGWFFIQTFDETDKVATKTFSRKELVNLLKNAGLSKLYTKVFAHYDEEPGHKHWHQILQVTGQKPS